MKKIVFAVLIVFLILLETSAASAVNIPSFNNKFVLRGYVVSNIPSGDFISKYKNVLPGLDKVDNAKDLADAEYTDNANAIPLFEKVNLFTYNVSNKKKWGLQELRDYYKKLPPEDYYEKESIISAINCAYLKNGEPATFTTRSEPKIEISYKKISVGRKTSYIAIRNIEKTNSVITHFLISPFKKPVKERINRFDFSYVYDINPSFASVLYQKQKSGNRTANFTGFFTDVPSMIPTNDYRSIVERSLEKFSEFVHKKNKILIVENLNPSTYLLGRYGDIVGINYPNEENHDEFLKQVRETFPNKVIFATINADLGNVSVLNGILRNLAQYGIYPEFRRDTSSGDFFYYEKSFSHNLNLINRYVKIIETENGFEFSKSFDYDKFGISEFDISWGKLYAISGNGNFNYAVSIGKTASVIDFNGNKVFTYEKNGRTYVKTNVNGFKILIVKNEDSPDILLLGMLPWISNGSASFVFKNLASDNKTIPIIIKNGNSILYSDKSTFLPLFEHLLTVNYRNESPIKIYFGNSVFTFGVLKRQFSFSLLLLFVLLFFLAGFYLFVKKKKPFKNVLSVKNFVLYIFLLPIILVIVNRYFVHYSLHTVTFFVFALMYFLLALYDTKFQDQSVLAFGIMLFLGFLFNFLEFRTLMPHIFDGILPFSRYYIMIYLAPFVFAILFFGMYGGAKVNKWEILIFILSIAGPTFIYKPFLSSFVLGINIVSFYPVLIALVGGGLLGVFHKKGFSAYLIIFVVFLGIIVLGIISSSRFYNLVVMQPESVNSLLIMKDIILFSLPLFFVLLLHHNIVKANPYVSLNVATLVVFSLVVFATYLIQWSVKFIGSSLAMRVFGIPSYIIVIFLMSIVLIEPINRKNQF